jgi:FkbM family methyltransferase
MQAVSVLKAVAGRLIPDRVRVHLQAADHYWRGEPELRLLRRVCPPGRVAVDIGANIGTYTYFLRRLAARVHAYEPNPELAARLRTLYPDVVVRSVAVSDRAAQVILRIPVGAGREQHELGSIAQSFESEARSCTVEALTLDSEKLQNVGFVKVDVEQHERQVLRGAMQTISAHRPNILTEVTPLRYEDRLDRTYMFLTNLGYAGWFGFGGRFLPLAAFEPEVHANPALWGSSDKFMRSNMFFFPLESPLAASGPAG